MHKTSKQVTLPHRAPPHQTGSDWSIKGWNQNGPCRVVVLHLSLLIHRRIDCVFIWKGNGGELMSEAAILAWRFPSSPVSYLAGCRDAGRTQDQLPSTLIWTSETWSLRRAKHYRDDAKRQKKKSNEEEQQMFCDLKFFHKHLKRSWDIARTAL